MRYYRARERALENEIRGNKRAKEVTLFRSGKGEEEKPQGVECKTTKDLGNGQALRDRRGAS